MLSMGRRYSEPYTMVKEMKGETGTIQQSLFENNVFVSPSWDSNQQHQVLTSMDYAKDEEIQNLFKTPHPFDASLPFSTETPLSSSPTLLPMTTADPVPDVFGAGIFKNIINIPISLTYIFIVSV
ncbi:hypothetical protein BGX27_009673 [Mortierella sp. AM989]|nr:hypothetical protein BGX27_009673 [Mortierella sp. AM989]